MRPAFATRRSDRVLIVLGLLTAGVVATWVDGARLRVERNDAITRNQRLAADLGLTDLCLFGDAPWLRHLSQGDRLASMQDFPGAFDYSRSGAVVAPRSIVVDEHGPVAEPPAIPR